MRRLAIALTALALLALLGYSLERSAWLFGLFERWGALAVAAAVVVELAAVALIAGSGALAHIDPSARAWANRALVAVLAVQALANLSAGYLRGGAATLALFGAGSRAAYVVAAVLWLVTNLAIPALVLCLSKLLERLLSAPSSAPLATSAITVSVPEALALPACEQASERPALSVSDSASTLERSSASLALDRSETSERPRWSCPRCGAALESGRALGAAKTNNGCRNCRGRERT